MGDTQSRRGRTARSRCRARRAADLESSFHDRRALAHPGQPEVTGRLLPLHRLLVHALAVVADRQPELPRLVVDRDDDAAAPARA